jgi:6-phosphogluconolactonase
VLSGTPIANTATGTTPFAIAIHPSGKFAYVVNEGSNSISAYSIDASTGALASIDADAYTTGMQASISTGAAYTPVAIAIDPAGTYAYVTSLGNSSNSASCGGVPATGCITAYKIDQATGALTSVPIFGSGNYIATGNTPSSIAVDGANLYVTNQANDNIGWFKFALKGQLTGYSTFSTLKTIAGISYGVGPSSIALSPVYGYAYVANTTSGDVEVLKTTGSSVTLQGAPKLTNGTLPYSIAVDSTGQYAYVADSGSNDIAVFNISSSGTTVNHVDCIGSTPLCTGTNFTSGTHPVSVATAP